MNTQEQTRPFESANQAQTIAEALQHMETSFPIEIISDPNSPRVQEVADLDAKLFGEHKSLPKEAFAAIIENGGAVFGHVNPDNKLISEASLILNAAPATGECPLERALPSWLAYCDGAAVSTEYRGRGLQKELLQAREKIAESVGKEASSASVRHRNLSSIRSMLKSGYMIAGDAPGYYGDAPEDDRIVMMKMFGVDNPLEGLDIQEAALGVDHKGINGLDEVGGKIQGGSDIISLVVQQSDEADGQLNEAMSDLLKNGYVGVSCHDLDIGDSDGDRESALVFVKLGTLGAVGEKFGAKQQELQIVLDGGGVQDSLLDLGSQSTEVTDSIEDVMQIECGDQQFSVEVIADDQIQEMAELDKQLFGEHKALSIEDLRRVRSHGALLAVRDTETSQMIAEGQAIAEAITDAEEPLVRNLPETSGYFEGFAVAPEERGTGVGIAIMRGVETVISKEGKTDIWATVRVENAPSMRNLTKEGYQVVGYSADYYEGEDLSGVRLVLRKDLVDPKIAASESDAPQPVRTNEADAPENSEIIIPVVAGDEIDANAHKLVKNALEAGYIGVDVMRGKDGQAYIIFRPSATVGDIQAQTRRQGQQQFLHDHNIVG